MANVVIWHPGLAQSAVVDEVSVGHYRTAGWLLKSEHDANEREAAQRAAAAQETGQGEQRAEGRKPAAQPGTGRGTLSQQHDAATGGSEEA